MGTGGDVGLGVGLLVGGDDGLAGVGLAVGNVGYGVGWSVGGCGRRGGARERFAARVETRHQPR